MLKIIIRFSLLICLAFIISAYADWNPTNSRVITLELNRGLLINVKKDLGSVFVADPSIVDFQLKTPGVLYLFSKKMGTTSLYATNKDGRVSFKFIIRVTQNLSDLKMILQQVLGCYNIRVFPLGDSIILQGAVASAAQAEDARSLAERFVGGDPKKVLTFLHVSAPTQVNLRVQVIEVTREVIRAIGIDWSAGFSTRNTQIAINPVLVPPEFAATSTGAPPNSVKFSGLLNRGNFSIQATINVLEQSGLVTILSEPNLTALSGETASFLVGGEFPIPVPQGNTGAVTVIFKKFGVSLAFTPTILENGKINLQVRPEVSQLSTQGAVNINGFQVPSLATRRAQTTVELRSGQSFSIAGLLQNNAQKTVQQLPWVANLPVIGKLFQSHRFLRNETELVIIVTPYIVQPAGNHALRYPTDNANADMTLSYSKRGKRRNVGFILE